MNADEGISLRNSFREAHLKVAIDEHVPHCAATVLGRRSSRVQFSGRRCAMEGLYAWTSRGRMSKAQCSEQLGHLPDWSLAPTATASVAMATSHRLEHRLHATWMWRRQDWLDWPGKCEARICWCISWQEIVNFAFLYGYRRVGSLLYYIIFVFWFWGIGLD